MTVEEAKKILKKEGFKLKGPGRAGVVSKFYTKYESPKICEAMQIVCSAGYEIMMLAGVFEERKARLRLELTENTKTPGPGEEQPKEKKGIIYPTTFPKADFHYYKHVLNEGNPALKESASQFNDALLDEQAKEIERLKNENAELLGMVERMKKDVKEVDPNFYAVNKENKRLDKKVLELIKDKELMKKATLSQLDDFIEIYNLLTKESQKTKRLGKEIARLNGIIHDKNEEIKRKTKGCCELVAENVDLKEGLRKTESLLHDTREANSKNLDTCFKNEDLINELKEKLAEKTKLAKKYAKELSDSSLDLCKLEKKLKKQLKDKNAVLSDVAEELRLSKIREKNLVEVSQKYMKENEELREKVAEKTKLVEMVRKGSKEYCEYGIAAEKMIQKLAKIIVGKGSVTSEDFEKCRRWAKGYRFNPQLPELSEEEEEKLKHAKKYRVSYDKAKEGGDQSVVTIVQCDNGITLSKEEVEIIERCTKNGTELHYSEKDGLTYTNMCGEEMPIICIRLMFHIYTDEEIKNMKK